MLSKRFRLAAFVVLMGSAWMFGGTSGRAESGSITWCYEEQECDGGWCSDRMQDCYNLTNQLNGFCGQVTECNGCGFVCYLPPA